MLNIYMGYLNRKWLLATAPIVACSIAVLSGVYVLSSASSVIGEQAPDSNSNITTFHASGQIGSLVSSLLGTSGARSSANSSDIYIVSGTWNLDVENGTVKNFTSEFGMVLQNGTDPHNHSILNLRNVTSGSNPSGNPTISMTPDHNVVLSGTSDIKTGNITTWQVVPITITIYHGYVVSINTDPKKDDYHFEGFPILGIVTSLNDANNKPLEPTILTAANSH